MPISHMTSTAHNFNVPDHYVSLFKEIDTSLRTQNRFHLPQHLESIVDNSIDYRRRNNSMAIDAGSTYFRARIHGIGQSSVYSQGDMGAPPSRLANPGRLNSEGMPILYVATTIDTSISEVRPWKGAEVSVAEVVIAKPLIFISLMPVNQIYTIDEGKNNAKNLLDSLIVGMLYFSSPNHAADTLAYLPTQYISQKIRGLGIDGVIYPSALSDSGENIGIFDPASCDIRRVLKYKVEKVTYSHAQSVA